MRLLWIPWLFVLVALALAGHAQKRVYDVERELDAMKASLFGLETELSYLRKQVSQVDEPVERHTVHVDLLHKRDTQPLQPAKVLGVSRVHKIVEHGPASVELVEHLP